MRAKFPCPVCDEPINYLVHSARVVAFLEFWVGSAGHAEYSISELTDEPGENQQWQCPSCDAVLFENEREATQFLGGI